MLGSLTLYRRLLFENFWSNRQLRAALPFSPAQEDVVVPESLPSLGHGIAGIMAGSTVSFVAAPVEHVKARLQIQYAADKRERLYRGPVDCVKKIVSLPPLFFSVPIQLITLRIMSGANHNPSYAHMGSVGSTTGSLPP